MDTFVNPRAIIGGNQPPLAERLAIDHAELVKRATEAADLVPDALRAIENDEEADAYTETAKVIKDVIKDADAAFTPEKAPWLDGGRTVETFFGFRATLKAKAAKAVAAVNAWQTAKLAAKRKADAEEAARLAREAALFDEPAPAAPPPVVAKEAVRIVTSTGAKASGSTYWKGDVTEIDKLPREYMVENQKMIDAAVAGGKREIPGVHIYEAVRTSIR